MAQLKALIVDDSQTMRRSISYALQRIPGLVCHEAQDGAEGLESLNSGPFDIIVTDINMPVMDGFGLIARIRKEGSPHRETPVVVISTESSPDDRRRALALGANAYLVKPFRAHTVIAAVKELLKLS